MNNMTVFWHPFNEKAKNTLRELSSYGSYHGVVYVLKWGPLVKIGCTAHPEQRIVNLCSLAKNYAEVEVGRLAITPLHKNYYETEKLIHQNFSKQRISKGELFDVPFLEAVEFLDSLEYEKYTQEELEAIKTENERSLEMFKSIVRGDYINKAVANETKTYCCFDFLNFEDEADMKQLVELQLRIRDAGWPMCVVVAPRGIGAQIAFTPTPFDLLLSWVKYGMRPKQFAVAVLNDDIQDSARILNGFEIERDELTGMYSRDWINVVSCIDKMLVD